MSSRKQSDIPAMTQISRRDLFLGAGVATGAIAALGGIAYAPRGHAALAANRTYFASQVLMEMDGKASGRLASAEGGEPFIERSGAGAALGYAPLTVRLSGVSPAVYDWIGKATNGQPIRHAVNIVTLDGASKENYRLAMQDVRLTEVTLDGLDVRSNAPALFTVKMAPGLSVHQFGKGSGATAPAQKPFPLTQSRFRLYIQGVEAATTRAFAVEPVGLRLVQDGGKPVPMALKFSLPFAEAGPLFAWMQDTLIGKGGVRPGELQLLTPDLSRVAVSVGLDQLMITRVSCPTAASDGSSQFQCAEVECAPGAVRFNMGELLT